jgi:hypothetical protein
VERTVRVVSLVQTPDGSRGVSWSFGHATFEDHGTLADSELDAVTGGLNATTNLRGNLDPAFARRSQMVIDFPRR